VKQGLLLMDASLAPIPMLVSTRWADEKERTTSLRKLAALPRRAGSARHLAVTVQLSWGHSSFALSGNCWPRPVASGGNGIRWAGGLTARGQERPSRLQPRCPFPHFARHLHEAPGAPDRQHQPAESAAALPHGSRHHNCCASEGRSSLIGHADRHPTYPV